MIDFPTVIDVPIITFLVQFFKEFSDRDLLKAHEFAHDPTKWLCCTFQNCNYVILAHCTLGILLVTLPFHCYYR